MDARGVECSLCLNCHHFKRLDAFNRRTRGAASHADLSHHCKLCLFRAHEHASRSGRARPSDAHEVDRWSIKMSADDVVACLPRPPAGASVIATARGGEFPVGSGRDVVKEKDICRVEHCGRSCIDAGKTKPHPSRLCSELHRGEVLWEVTPHAMREVRWRSRGGLTSVAGRPDACEPRARVSKRRLAEEDIIRAPDSGVDESGYPWLRWFTGRVDIGAPKPARGSGRTKATNHPHPELRKKCLVHGCDRDAIPGHRGEVCASHVHAVVVSERQWGLPALWLCCRACKVWRAACGFGRDGRCGPGCKKQGALGGKAPCQGEVDAVRVEGALKGQQARASSEPSDICASLGIGTVVRMEDGHRCGYLARGGTRVCGAQLTDNHASGRCIQHRFLVVSQGGALLWYCGCCNEMRPVAEGVHNGACAACYVATRDREAFLAGQPRNPSIVTVEPVPSKANCTAAAVPTACSVQAERFEGASTSNERVESTLGLTVVLDGSDDCSMRSVDHSECDDLSESELVGVTEVEVHVAADVEAGEGDAKCCRGEDCEKPRDAGPCLNGYCLVCVATNMTGASSLEMFVLATVTGCLHKGAGAFCGSPIITDSHCGFACDDDLARGLLIFGVISILINIVSPRPV